MVCIHHCDRHLFIADSTAYLYTFETSVHFILLLSLAIVHFCCYLDLFVFNEYCHQNVKWLL